MSIKKIVQFRRLAGLLENRYNPVACNGHGGAGNDFLVCAACSGKSSKMATEDVPESAVKIAYSLTEDYGRRAANGEFSTGEAQEKAKGLIRMMRFGKDEGDYILINDLNAVTLLNPPKPELEGKTLSDPRGQAHREEMSKICLEKGSGFIEYLWPKSSGERPSAKISFVKLYKPWGWVIGSGVYADDTKGFSFFL